MSLQLINHSPDLKKLQDEGYSIEIQSAYLIIGDIPYVNSEKEVRVGKLVTALDLAGNSTIQPQTHALYFIGQLPCNKDGVPINKIVNNSNSKVLAPNLKVDHYLSSKPKGRKYKDYYEKISTYVGIISGPAKALKPEITEKKFKTVQFEDDEYFYYFDTISSRAEISKVTDILKQFSVGIIGLGGTGSYILDYLAKVPLKEIRIFDDDRFLQHNAFRAPGAADIDNLKKYMKKVEYFYNIYSRLNKNITVCSEYVNEDNLKKLNDLDIVFICIDSVEPKKLIIDFCLENKIKFIDSGIGAETVENTILAQVRTTTYDGNTYNHLKDYIPLSETIEDEVYKTNIQIAELNAFNAAVAVIKWKKMIGFYMDQNEDMNSTYCVNTNRVHNFE